MKQFNNTIGRKVWAVVGGRMPLDQTGPEPEFSSHDSLAILNASGEDAEVEVTIFYADKDPVGPYELEVKARRTREVRFNDFIDPEALPLETNYSAIVESSVPIVVRFSQQDTRQAENARTASMAFPADD